MAEQVASARRRRSPLPEPALLEERARIARDLHDHVIQRLFAIGLSIQRTANELPDPASRRLRAAIDDIDETIAQIRTTIYRLNAPIPVAETSLRARIDQLVDDLEPVLGVRPDLEINDAVDLGVSGELADDCVAVLREALSNVARHAAATAVAVRVCVTPDELRIEVTDDGRGIGGATRRSGLANLRDRARCRDGELTVTTRDPSGTRLCWTVPPPQADAHGGEPG